MTKNLQKSTSMRSSHYCSLSRRSSRTNLNERTHHQALKLGEFPNEMINKQQQKIHEFCIKKNDNNLNSVQ